MCQEVPFGNSRIQEIHASPRDLSQLVTTFFGSRAEPSPSRVVASDQLLYIRFLTFGESSGVQASRFVVGFLGHIVSPQGNAASSTSPLSITEGVH